MSQQEFEETEDLYCSCLGYLWRHYVQPGLIKYPNDDAARAFGSALLGVHMNHQGLLRVVREQKMPFWEALQLHMLSLSSSHMQFAEAQPTAAEFLAKVPCLAASDDQGLPSSVDARPASLASMPYQRVPRYALLLEQRLKQASKAGDTVAEAALSKTLHGVNSLCNKINLLQRKGHSDARKAELSSRLNTSPTTFGDGTILAEGTFEAKMAQGASRCCIALLTTEELVVLCCKDARRHKVKAALNIPLTQITSVCSTSSPLCQRPSSELSGVAISYNASDEMVLEADDDLLASQWVMDLSIAIDAACHRGSL